MANVAPTVIDLKKAFLTSQVRLLNAPPQPPRTWQDDLPETDDGQLRDNTVADVLSQVESKVRHHSKVAYSSQALRQVSEQIDALYWASADTGHAAFGLESEEDALSKDQDFSEDDVIVRLPSEWADDEERYGEAQLDRYAQLHARLTALSLQRQEARRRLEQYKQAMQLLDPLKDPQRTVQPNLVTRDSELGRELERMRMLMVRVGARVGTLKAEGNGHNQGRELDLVEMETPQQNVDEFLRASR
ncbi:MAG: hypothetical protein M1825_002729 [Sarcosagium campestre]|nr:MAG: hypothetical protein M1825_002729 [Sarcosagium campestre]